MKERDRVKEQAKEIGDNTDWLEFKKIKNKVNKKVTMEKEKNEREYSYKYDQYLSRNKLWKIVKENNRLDQVSISKDTNK